MEHLYMDLRPWVCHEAACEYGNDSFHSRDDWIQHLALQHGFDNGWQSIECPFCLEPTGSGKVVIVKHLSSHMEEISLASLPAGVDSDSDDESSSIASEHSESAEANQNHPALGPKVINRIHELILRPLLAKPALKDFEPILLDVPRQIQSKEIICLRDLEKTLILMAPERTKTAALYIDFCLASVRFIQATVEYLSDREKTRPGDRPYTNGYFIDLKDNILEYGRQLAAANVSPEDMGIDASGETKLFGGIAVNGRPAELVRVLKDGTHISMDTGKVVDVDEAPIKIKRSLSEQREGEQEIIKSMARRKKISPEELAPKKCKEPGCDKAFKRRCDLTKHEKTHSRPWKCPLPACKYHHYGWPNKKEMDRHFNAKHVEPPALYECLYKPCLYKFKRESNCKQHMEKAHGWTYVRTKKNGMAPNAASEQGHFTTHQVLGGYSAIYGDTDSVQPQLPTTDQPSATAKANPESN
ncbi:hypothetical protein B0J13DRAFT_322822 [Dactylonectria estremocensis]|uniref:C2H2-type domain-containing protein n=1 Tax=Dactylonectria estremocensis TaxID=1079267 RepID=A0A9P9ETT8_9HYPO|nr:hypothetical protein B0J13DRAFT_322822 [Dactylonectria estremocensis]